MKISCEIIKDLLPLYHDGVCSSDSKKMVEEHLIYCNSCKKELQTIDNKLSINNTTTRQNLKEAEPVKKLSKKWENKLIKSSAKGIFLTIIIVLLIIIALYCFDFRIAPSP